MHKQLNCRCSEAINTSTRRQSLKNKTKQNKKTIHVCINFVNVNTL